MNIKLCKKVIDYGEAADILITVDWDADGKDDIGIFRSLIFFSIFFLLQGLIFFYEGVL